MGGRPIEQDREKYLRRAMTQKLLLLNRLEDGKEGWAHISSARAMPTMSWIRSAAAARRSQAGRTVRSRKSGLATFCGFFQERSTGTEQQRRPQ
jgi:hypothetical protein